MITIERQFYKHGMEFTIYHADKLVINQYQRVFPKFFVGPLEDYFRNPYGNFDFILKHLRSTGNATESVLHPWVLTTFTECRPPSRPVLVHVSLPKPIQLRNYSSLVDGFFVTVDQVCLKK